ncbi:MAG: toll/interleukin-1 receptor domain-containing protein [Chloroflexota bacterium]
MSSRLFAGYLRGVETLLERLGSDHPRYDDVIRLKIQLRENIENENNVEEIPGSEPKRARIITQLNRISLEELHISFDGLCFPQKNQSVSFQSQTPEASQIVNIVDKPRKPDHQKEDIYVPAIPSKPALTEAHPSTRDGNQDSQSGNLIFISHSSVDKSFVDRLEGELVGLAQVWYDKKSIKVSQSIPGKINEGLTKCKYFLVVLTPDSVAAPWVQKEIDAALMSNKVIVPVLLKDCEVPPLLKAYKYADFRVDYQSGVNNLLEGLDFQKAARVTPGLIFIFGVIARACDRGDIPFPKGQRLKELFASVAKKKEIGEKSMLPKSPDNSGELFSNTSQLLMYDLLSLADYHAEWPHLVVSDQIKRDSVKLLKNMKDQVLISSALVQQLTNLDFSSELERILTPLDSLQSLLKNIDDHLLSGNVPFHVSSEIERSFDDLTYHLNMYLSVLDELADKSGINRQLL